MALVIHLTELPPVLRGPNDAAYKGSVPARMRFMAPDAAHALLRLNASLGGLLVFTDILRSADASLAALRTKRGVQPPGFSGHNFGFSFDLDLGASLRALDMTYAQLLARLEASHFFCHRLDGSVHASEAWHFNFLTESPGDYLAKAEVKDPRTWARPVELLIQERYGHTFQPSPGALQLALADLGYYGGAIDGILGPLSREAIRAFQRAFNLIETSPPDARTLRTLVFVASTRQLDPPRPQW